MAGFMYVYIYTRPECSGVSSNSDSGAGLTANKSPGESNSGAGERGGEGVMGPARGGVRSTRRGLWTRWWGLGRTRSVEEAEFRATKRERRRRTQKTMTVFVDLYTL